MLRVSTIYPYQGGSGSGKQNKMAGAAMDHEQMVWATKCLGSARVPVRSTERAGISILTTQIPTELNGKGMHGNGSVKSGTGMKCVSFGAVSCHDQSSQIPAADRATRKRTLLFQWSYFKTSHRAGTTSLNRVSVPFCQSNQGLPVYLNQQLLSKQNNPRLFVHHHTLPYTNVQ